MSTIRFKKLNLPLRICVSILLLGGLFKIMHWPNSSNLLLIAICSIMVLYPIRFFLKKEKETMDYIKLGIILLWCLSNFTRVIHVYQFPVLLNIALLLLFGWWFINEGTAYFTNQNLKLNGIYKTVYVAVTVIIFGCILFGCLFKIQHWPYGNLLFTVGIFLASIFVIVDHFLRK